MKILILFLLSFSLFAQSPEERRAKERLKDLQVFKAKECQGVKSEFCNHVDTQIKISERLSAKKLVAEIVHNADRKVNAEIAEETAVVRLTDALVSEGGNVGDCQTSTCLQKKLDLLVAQKRESECLASAKAQADSLSVTYLQTDTCKQVQKKIDDFLKASAPIGTATGS